MMPIKWLDEHFSEIKNFPRPDWEGIHADVEQYHGNANPHELWCGIARSWADRLASSLPSDYALHESDNFILVTSESEQYVSRYQNYIERTLKRVMSALHGIASDDDFGKYVVLIFDDIDLYYSYLSCFYEKDGVYGISSGVYLNKGYGHFALPHQELAYTEGITAHEMTHALVSHLPVPAWLNEGVADGIENLMAHSAPLRMDDEMRARHRLFWGATEIQGFWSGDAFQRSGEGLALSYHLAQLCVNSLAQDYDAFIQFANKAHYADGGEAAVKAVYKGNLGNLVTQYLGEGDWTPKPDTWT